MTEQPSEQHDKSFAIQRIYTQDLSFESPLAPKVFVQDFKPEISVDIQTKHQLLDDTHTDVVVSVTVTARHEDQTVFLAEVHQGGSLLCRDLVIRKKYLFCQWRVRIFYFLMQESLFLHSFIKEGFRLFIWLQLILRAYLQKSLKPCKNNLKTKNTLGVNI